MSILHRRRATNTRSCIQMLCIWLSTTVTRSPVRRSDRQHPETSMCAEQRSSDRAPNAKTIPHQAAAAPPALVDQRIIYKMAVVTFKVQRTATPAYPGRYLQPRKFRNCARNLRSSDTPVLCQPFTKTDFARRGFRYSAPAVWNSLLRTVKSPSITVFKSRLKTRLFWSGPYQTITTWPVLPPSLKLRPVAG